MKQKCTTKLFAILAVACIFVMGCREENDDEVFTALTQDYNDNKDYISGSMVFWSDGDAVRINNGIYSIAVDDHDSHRATINAEGVTALGGEYYAAYPADISNVVSAGHITFSLPQEELYTENDGKQVIHSIMAAKSDNRTFKFQNLCALLHFKVNAIGDGIGDKLLAIEVETDKPMWGTITAEYGDNQWQVTSVSGTDATKRTLRFATPLVLSASEKDIYLIVPPVSGAETFTLRMIVDDGSVKVFEKTRTASTSFASGTLWHFNAVNTYTGTAMKYGTDEVATVTDGSEDHPYLVYSSENWAALASRMDSTGKHITLANDINVGSTLDREFKAILDGNGHTITLTTQNISLFSTINGGTVKNLTLAATNDVTEPVMVSDGDNLSSDNYYGTLAGKALNGSTIVNCINTVNIFANSDLASIRVGGLCGQLTGSSISNCLNNGNITSNALYVGGVVGMANNLSHISNCTNNGTITISSTEYTVKTKYCGGISGSIGTSNGVVINSCNNHGPITINNISSTILYCGGVFGEANSDISECSNTGTITCNATTSTTKNIGGIVGRSITTIAKTICNSFNEGNIYAADGMQKMIVGGLLGENKRMSITNCYVYGNLSGSSVAGITYYGADLFDNVVISNCYYYGTITCSSTNKYGIAGISHSSYKFIIDHCYYPSDYSMCHSTSNDNGNNATLRSATTLTNDSSLATALHNNLRNMPAGSYDWQNSTSGPAHVVFVTGSK